jgi:hypothetical protein
MDKELETISAEETVTVQFSCYIQSQLEELSTTTNNLSHEWRLQSQERDENR